MEHEFFSFSSLKEKKRKREGPGFASQCCAECEQETGVGAFKLANERSAKH